MRIQQKKADDESLYKRAKKAVANGDKTMKPLVEYYEGTRTPTREKYPAQYNLRERIISKHGSTTATQLQKQYGAYHSFWYRLLRKRYRKVPEGMARKMLTKLTGEDHTKEQDWDSFYRAQKFLREVDVLKTWCRKNEIPYQKACKIRQGTYKNVPEVVEEILGVIEG